MDFVHEIDSISFDLLSAEEIVKMSAFEVTNSKLSTSKPEGTIHDPRSGSMGSDPCVTCKLTQECPGHFGHIQLNIPVLHPLFYDHIVNILNIFCSYCYELLLDQEYLEINNILKTYKYKRLSVILDKIKKFDKCYSCNNKIQEYKLVTTDISKTIYNVSLGAPASVDDVQTIFNNIKATQCTAIGISHPKNLCMTVFPIIPVCCRPYEIVDGGIHAEDITQQLLEIVKNNIMIANTTGDKRKKHIDNLKFRLETFYNNHKGKAHHTTTGRPIRGIRERIVGKEGLMRTNLLGKRCEESARTVVGPDPLLKINEISMPKIIAKSLTIPVICNKWNKSKLEHLCNNQDAVRIVRGSKRYNINALINCNGTLLQHGDVVVKADGTEIVVHNTAIVLEASDKLFRNNEEIPVVLPKRNQITLQHGDVVHRFLQDGDIVLLNRQPTLHKGSMMAHNIKIREAKIIGINLANTKSYNADFDGDEMNLHVPQSIEAQAEMMELSQPESYIISNQSGNPNLTIVQDSLTAAYLMSIEPNTATTMTPAQMNDIIMQLLHPRTGDADVSYFLQKIHDIGTRVPSVRNGRGLLSLILLPDFDVQADDLTISRGVILGGWLSKKYLSATKTSLIKLIYNEYGSAICSIFINNIQFLTNKWLMYHSFSINAKDCISEYRIPTNIFNTPLLMNIDECDDAIRESLIANDLANIRNESMKSAKDMLATDNNFLVTIKSGSKGDYYNLLQITSLLAQQNIQDKRIKPMLTTYDGMKMVKRTLPHYPRKLDHEDEYKSRGFITSSFCRGLSPTEFIFHSMSGRTGVIDTAVSTSRCGYTMRRIVKTMENMKINYDNTVSDTYGRIYQTSYAGTGYDPSQKLDDVSRLVNQLNAQHENINYNK